MNIFQLLLCRDLPPDFKFTYGKFISGRKRLKNGWQAAWFSNGFTFMLHKTYEGISVPAVKKISEAVDGKFMLKTRSGDKVIYSPDGKQIAPFDAYSLLYPNGWYKYRENGAISLYDSKGRLVGNNLRFAKVYPNGMYRMSVNEGGNAEYAGVFDAAGNRLWFSNSTKIKVLRNGWFVDDNILIDNTGRIYIDELPERKVPRWLLRFIGSWFKPVYRH